VHRSEHRQERTGGSDARKREREDKESDNELNHSILAKVSGVTHTFTGYDKVVHETQERGGHYAEDVEAGYAPEYLQTLTPNGFPKAKLELR
jgi:hypothetical protein